MNDEENDNDDDVNDDSDDGRLLLKAPIDVRTLEKGHDYDPIELGLMTNVKPTDRRYSLLLMKLVDRINFDIEVLGLQLSVCTYHNMIRVNTDSQAIRYHDKEATNSLVRMARNAQRIGTRIDARNLNSDEENTRLRLMFLWGHRVSAAYSDPQRVKPATDTDQKKIEGKHNV